MEKKSALGLKLVWGFVVIAAALFVYVWKDNASLSGDDEIRHTTKPVPTRSLMDIVSIHTSKILDAIMVGDFNEVAKESNAVAETSEAMMKDFFPESGEVGDWFKETGKDPKNPDDVKAVKKDFEKYVKTVVEASKNIAETSKKYNIVETYKSFDAMLQKACFSCHETFRPKWPEWPEWMQISGG